MISAEHAGTASVHGRRKVLHVVGARPNFMKVAPVYRAIAVYPIDQILVHTGQHYDYEMSDIFFEELGIPHPTVNLKVGSGSHAVQTASIMEKFEPLVIAQRPDLVLLYGDVNSTLAASLVCSKLDITVGHVEAGLRSFDRSMPEEINRVVTDRLADYHFTPSADGDSNLLKEGIRPEQIFRVGNVMIDTLIRMLPAAESTWRMMAKEFALEPSGYGLVTLHRPSNVDDPKQRGKILEVLSEISGNLKLIFPVHPRTAGYCRSVATPGSLVLTRPRSYVEFLALQQRACCVITDSGGIQEESTYLRVPCLTLRTNTERPVTVSIGSNTLVGQDLLLLRSHVAAILSGNGKRGAIPELWDGCAGSRVAEAVWSVLSRPLVAHPDTVETPA